MWEGPFVPFILTCGQAELLVRGAGLTHRERETCVIVTAQLEEIKTHHQRPQRDGSVQIQQSQVSVSLCTLPHILSGQTNPSQGTFPGLHTGGSSCWISERVASSKSSKWLCLVSRRASQKASKAWGPLLGSRLRSSTFWLKLPPLA